MREERRNSQRSGPHLGDNPEEGGGTTSAECVSHDSSGQFKSSSKSLQTDEMLVEQLEMSTLLAEVRDLHRDKRLLEDQLEVCRLTFQSEQGALKERCAEMEVTMESVREHNLCLQATLTQLEFQCASDKTRDQNEIDNAANTDKGKMTPTSDVETCVEEVLNIEEEILLKTDDEWSEMEESPPPTMDQDIAWSHNIHYEEVDCAANRLQSIQQEDILKEVDTCTGDEQDHGTYSPEELLQQNVDQLLSVLGAHSSKDTQSGDNKEFVLIDAAEQIGDSLLYLVDAVRQVPREKGIYTAAEHVSYRL
ncbi:dystrotelin-like [Corythoichthys intestinalis]|uniref:dystrotelin-like n=1 Tax=Corythoichthys intestinalis TaxID=161448 RepID=UPI0025A4FADB|nr:dystrotelin-like [Corythoichthys intestinalis]